MNHFISKLFLIITSLYFFLLPLFFLPEVSPWIDFSKRFLGVIVSLALLFLWTLKLGKIGVIKFKYTTITPFIIAFLISLILSVIFSVNKPDSLWTVSPILCSIIIYLAILNNIKTEGHVKLLKTSLIVSALFISLLTIAKESLPLSIGFLSPLSQNPNSNSTFFSALLDKNVSFVGNLFAQSLFLIITLSFLLKNLFPRPKENQSSSLASRISSFLSLIIILTGFLLTVNHLIKTPPIFLDWNNTYKTAASGVTISGKISLFGVGPGNFSVPYLRFRDISQNLTKFGNTKFETSHSEVLNLLVATGILGMVSFLLILIFLIKGASKLSLLACLTSLILIVISVLFPLPPAIWLLFFPAVALISLSEREETKTLILTQKVSTLYKTQLKIPSLILFSLTLVFNCLVFFYTYRLFMAEKSFNQSQLEAGKGNVQASYDALGKSVKLSPWNETYQRFFSKTNLAIALVLAQQKNLTDEGKSRYLNHIQLAVQGGRIAASLNPNKVENVENLADIYQALGGSLEGAENWAMVNYQNAINLFPGSPDLHIKKGGIFLAQNDFDSAIKEFQTAVNLKPNHPNAHYNLSFAYKKNGDLKKAEEEIREVLKLIPKESKDYETAKKEFDSIVNTSNK